MCHVSCVSWCGSALNFVTLHTLKVPRETINEESHLTLFRSKPKVSFVNGINQTHHLPRTLNSNAHSIHTYTNIFTHTCRYLLSKIHIYIWRHTHRHTQHQQHNTTKTHTHTPSTLTHKTQHTPHAHNQLKKPTHTTTTNQHKP